MSDARKYSDTEVRAIIDRALAGETGSDGLSHHDLLAVGEQVGVSAEVMTRAAREVSEAQLDGKATRSLLSRRRRWLAAHAGIFAIINGLFFAVNALTTPGEWWSLFPIVFWGIALALHAGLTFVPPLPKRSIERERQRLLAEEARDARRVRVAPAADRTSDAETEERDDAESGSELRRDR